MEVKKLNLLMQMGQLVEWNLAIMTIKFRDWVCRIIQDFSGPPCRQTEVGGANSHNTGES
jgi:hypothetical protein